MFSEINFASLSRVSKSILVILIMSLFFVAFETHAAELRFNPTAKIVNSGDEFIIDIVLDAGGADINTIEGTLQYPSDQLELIQTRIAGSIITFWIEQPSTKVSGRVAFGGTIVGGYLGTGGTVFSAVFKTPKQTLAEDIKSQITIVNAKGYLNDGLGGAATMTTKPANLTIKPAQAEADTEVVGVIEDTILPEVFTPEVGQDPSLFDNRWFVAFSTEDKQSGIEYYEVQESSSVSPDESKWQRSTSPRVLVDQTRNSYIHVRAVDAAGNMRTAVVAPGSPAPKIPWPMIGGSAIVIIILVALWFLLKKRKGGFDAVN